MFSLLESSKLSIYRRHAWFEISENKGKSIEAHTPNLFALITLSLKLSYGKCKNKGELIIFTLH